MKRWLARYSEDIGLLVIVLAVIAGICWAGWHTYKGYVEAQAERAKQNRESIERAAKAMHKAWCNHPPGGLADGSCWGTRH